MTAGAHGGDGLGARGDAESKRTTRGRPVQLLIGMLWLGALALLFSQAARLPGPVGEAVRGNATADRDATALFYTEVDGWPSWPDRGATP